MTFKRVTGPPGQDVQTEQAELERLKRDRLGETEVPELKVNPLDEDVSEGSQTVSTGDVPFTPAPTSGTRVGSGKSSRVQVGAGFAAALQDRMAKKGLPAEAVESVEQGRTISPEEQRARIAQLQAETNVQGEAALATESVRPELSQQPSATADFDRQQFEQARAANPQGASNRFNQNASRRLEAAREAALEPYNNEIKRLKRVKENLPATATAEELSEIDNELAKQHELKAQAKKSVNQELANQSESFQVEPFVESEWGDIIDRIERDERRVAQFQSDHRKFKDTSKSGKAMLTFKNIIKPALSSTAPLVNVPQGEFDSVMDLLEKASGISDASFLANSVVVAVAQAALGGTLFNDTSKRGGDEPKTLDDAGIEVGLIGLDTLSADALLEQKTWGPDEIAADRLKTLPEWSRLAGLLGNIMINNLQRQGANINMPPIVIGENILSALDKANQIKIVPWTDPSTGLKEYKVGFHPDIMVGDIAAAAALFFPKIQKMGPVTQGGAAADGTLYGYEGDLKLVSEKMTKGLKGDTSVSQDAALAAMHTEQVPRTAQGPELLLTMMLNQMAKENMTLLGQQVSEGKKRLDKAGNEVDVSIEDMLNYADEYPANHIVGAVKFDKKDDRHLSPAEQNLNVHDVSIEAMQQRNESIFFHRVKLGANSSRLYAVNRDNPTYYKEIRGVERAAPNAVPKIIPSSRMFTQIPKRAVDLKKYIEKNVLPTISKEERRPQEALTDDIGRALPDQFREMQFFSILGSLLSDNSQAKRDPSVAMQEAAQNLQSWAEKGAPFLETLGGDGSLESMVKARRNGTPTDLPLAELEMSRSALEELIQDPNYIGRDNFGYVVGALIDAALFMEVYHHNALNPDNLIEFFPPSVVQYDITSAGPTTMAKDGGNMEGIKSAGLSVPVDTDGNPLPYNGPRELYAKITKAVLPSVYKGLYEPEMARDLQFEVESLIQDMISEDTEGKFVNRWGKNPEMTTSYSKHQSTHHGHGIDIFKKYPKFKDALLIKYEEVFTRYNKGEVNHAMMLDDIAKIHEKTLVARFGQNELDGITAMKEAVNLANMNGKPFKVHLFGQDMIFGVEREEIVDYDMIGGQELPIHSGQQMFDPLGRAAKKKQKTWDAQGNVTESDFTPDPGTGTYNAFLAALGHKRESIIIDGIINYIQQSAPGAYFGNFYDGVSGDANSALLVWYYGNYVMPAKAMEESPRPALFEAAVEHANEFMAKMANLTDPIDVSYPQGIGENNGAIGFKLDTLYAKFVQSTSNLKKGQNVSESLRTLNALFKNLKAAGWTPPNVIEDSNQPVWDKQRSGFSRYKLDSQQREDYELSPKQAKLAAQVILYTSGVHPSNKVKYEKLKEWVNKGKEGTGVTHKDILEAMQGEYVEWFTTK